MPVEVVPVCWKFTANRFPDLFKDCGFVAKLRTCYEKHNGNCIIDLYFKKDIVDMKLLAIEF